LCEMKQVLCPSQVTAGGPRDLEFGHGCKSEDDGLQGSLNPF
jgi:hypothetical protein